MLILFESKSNDRDVRFLNLLKDKEREMTPHLPIKFSHRFNLRIVRLVSSLKTVEKVAAPSPSILHF